MPRKLRRKKYQIITHWVGVVGGIILCAIIQNATCTMKVEAAECPDLKIIFARGSGAPYENNEDYQAFKSSLTDKLKWTNISYEFEDLEYPAVGVGAKNLMTTLGAYFSSGESYDFGASVNIGVQNLIRDVNGTLNDGCFNTKYVMAGYSQGANVVLKALESLDTEPVIYVATFGDPKIYLPEGKATLAVSVSGKNGLHTGLIPPACKNENLSSYRAYVPDCYAYEGVLGGRRPYQSADLNNKLGTWCNKYDILCSSYYSIDSHTSYVRDGLYEDASKVIFARIMGAFGLENNYVSEHDTAIIIDTTWSMEELIDTYKTEALRLAKKTFDSGGRVALFDYRDLSDPYELEEHCNFDTCTMEIIERELNELEIEGGGDAPESLLSASFVAMNKLSWNYGATKSVVVLTDAGFHSPDIDGTTFADVVRLSKQIDPVNFYIITTPEISSEYSELAEMTDGEVATTIDDLSLLTDKIMARFDSLPRVEELTTNDDGVVIIDDGLPELTITALDDSFGEKVTVFFENSGIYTLVVLNDLVMGTTDKNYVEIDGLDRTISNRLRLVPLSETRRGKAVDIEIGATSNNVPIIVPKAPDTGMIK